MNIVRPLVALFALVVLLTPGARAQDVVNLYVGDGPVHFSLRDGSVVADTMVTEDNWDVIINGTDLTPNVAGLLLEQTYDAVTEVPAEGLVEGVVRTASGERWFEYDMQSHFVWPAANRTFAFQLPGDRVAKLEIYSYYNLETEEPRFLSFRYDVSEPGSRSF